MAKLGRGLTSAEAAELLRRVGPNSVRNSNARAVHVLLRQFRSPLLSLLLATAVVSFLLGEHTDAVIITIIVIASVGLGFINEFRAARAAEALRRRFAHQCTVWRDEQLQRIESAFLVPGDVVEVRVGDIVPADLELQEATGLECDESALTGESVPESKEVAAGPVGRLRMGTIVTAGTGIALVDKTGKETEFGRIAQGLEQEEAPTNFQRGLNAFSMLLVRVAVVLTAAIFAVNLILHRPLIDAVLFSLAIAVGISPQLLPAVVSTSMTRGAHRLAKRKVLVKRLVSIEDLGDIETLFTDKTGTLTEGTVTLDRAVDADDVPRGATHRYGALCTDVTPLADGSFAGNPLDIALLNEEHGSLPEVLTRRAFDHEHRTAAVIVRDQDGILVRIEKGAPEAVFAAVNIDRGPLVTLATEEMRHGNRVIAVSRARVDRPDIAAPGTHAELLGLLIYRDPVKESAAHSLQRLADLGVQVHIVTGDAKEVAEHVCAEFPTLEGGALTGAEIDRMDDAALAAAIPGTRVFARVSPEQKARIVRVRRAQGTGVAFIGDGVNDALAIHEADVGISVDSGTDVARDAADVILLEKDLNVLADGVMEGRRIFANTIKYILMGTSSNFGNMFSAAIASAFLPFLPMLPHQILLNNLLYDASQLAIPTDRVDDEQVARPAEWDIASIRRYMLIIGPLSSLFDLITFVIMRKLLDANAELFHSGWFVESLATQTLIVLVIRTQRRPFWRSSPSGALGWTVATMAIVGGLLPMSPIAGVLGFVPLPAAFQLTVLALVLIYMVIVDRVKRWAGTILQA